MPVIILELTGLVSASLFYFEEDKDVKENNERKQKTNTRLSEFVIYTHIYIYVCVYRISLSIATFVKTKKLFWLLLVLLLLL